MKNVVFQVYGDSLSMPRSWEGIHVPLTYPEIVLRRLAGSCHGTSFHLYNRSRGGGNILVLLDDYRSDAAYFGESRSTVLVVQCGVCDCAPRPVSTGVRRSIGKLPVVVRRAVVSFLHSNRTSIQKVTFWRQVQPEQFAEKYEQWLQFAAVRSGIVLAVNIAPITKAMEVHSCGWGASIEEYNELIRTSVERVGARNIRLVNVNDAIRAAQGGVDRHINAKDGHHLTVDGHVLYADMIGGAIEAWLGESASGETRGE